MLVHFGQLQRENVALVVSVTSGTRGNDFIVWWADDFQKRVVQTERHQSGARAPACFHPQLALCPLLLCGSTGPLHTFTAITKVPDSHFLQPRPGLCFTIQIKQKQALLWGLVTGSHTFLFGGNFWSELAHLVHFGVESHLFWMYFSACDSRPWEEEMTES